MARMQGHSWGHIEGRLGNVCPREWVTEVNLWFGAKDNNPEWKKKAKVAGSWGKLRLVIAS